MDSTRLSRFVQELWQDSVTRTLCEYIRIPNQSPGFDPRWRENGYMDAAVDLVCDWIRAQNVSGLQLDVVRIEGRTPLIYAEIPGASSETVLLYGHLDKQPPMDGWHEGLGAWTPVIRDGRLYGRGAADDGYAAFAAIGAIKALQEAKQPHARCVVLIEASEESGSGDLPAYIEALQGKLRSPGLVICLDSGCGDYDRLWATTSLRGLLNGTLTVRVLTEGIHSGGNSGIVPSTFRIARQLLSRIEDEKTGRILLPEVNVDVPAERLEQLKATAAVVGPTLVTSVPFIDAAQPQVAEIDELLLNRNWRAQLEITGAAGLPALENAGNVMRPQTTLKLSLRLPPTADAQAAAARVKSELERDPPYGAQVSFDCREAARGWNAPALQPWLAQVIDAASAQHFGAPACFMGEGGTIPFMAMLGRRFPQAQFLITGVLGPHSNAHGPNEFLDLRTAQRVTASVAQVLAAHAQQAQT